jgi:regulator of RNase E activity RraA
MSQIVGFRIYTNTPHPEEAQINAFRGVPTGNIADAMDRMGAMDYRIKPISNNTTLCGPALTVRTRPGDNLMVWKALEVATPGDVLVIATYDYPTASTFGEFVVMAAKAKGLAGIVSDGMCRDVTGIRATNLPVFAAGTVPSSPQKDGPGEIGGPVSCGGLVVHPGDMVVGDEDGVVVVPLADIQAVLGNLKVVREKEAHMRAMLKKGFWIPEGINEILSRKEYEVVPKGVEQGRSYSGK